MTPALLLDQRTTPHTMGTVHRAADLVLTARERERAGCIPEAIEQYEAAIAQAERQAEHTVLAEALRRLAVVRHQRDEKERARELCNRSIDVATEIGNDLLAGEALNTLGGMLIREGSLSEAKATFLRALQLGGAHGELRARAEQNLGTVASIHGELDEAITRYARSLNEYQNFER